MIPKDFEIKESVLECSQDKEYNKAKRKAFLGDCSAIQDFKINYGEEVARVARNIVSSQYKKYKRVRDRTTDIIVTSSAVFLTLTFSDETLAKTSEKTRREYVRKYLKTQSTEFVANIDYGTKNEREHYHAIIYAPNQKIDLAPWKKRGFIFAEKIRFKDSEKRLAKYIAKLTRHALKESTKRKTHCPRLIYSRHTRGISFLEDILPF